MKKQILQAMLKIIKVIKVNLIKYNLPILTGGVLVSLVLSSMTLFYASKPLKISKIAINSITDSYVNHLAKEKMDNTLRQKLIAKFSKILEQEMNALGNERQELILIDEAVIFGGRDLTQILGERIKEKIHAQTK